MKKKTISIILLIISIINIICIIYGFIVGELGHKSFNVSLSPIISNIPFLAGIVLLLQILNIVLIIVGLNKQKKVILWVIAITIITVFIPVKNTHSIKYKYPTSRKNTEKLNVLDPSSMGSTTHIYSYENLYGITLKNDKSTSLGMEIY